VFLNKAHVGFIPLKPCNASARVDFFTKAEKKPSLRAQISAAHPTTFRVGGAIPTRPPPNLPQLRRDVIAGKTLLAKSTFGELSSTKHNVIQHPDAE